MSPATSTSPNYLNLVEITLDVVLNSKSLADLCKRAIDHEMLSQVFDGAHIMLNTNNQFNYDCGHGQPLPLNHLDLAQKAAASKKIEFLPQSDSSRAQLAVPFLHNGIVEAIGIWVLKSGETQPQIDGPIEDLITKLTGFFLVTSIGLDH